MAEAIEKKDYEKASAVLKDGADINAIGNEGNTLLFWALLYKNKEGFTWLLDHGANPNITPGV